MFCIKDNLMALVLKTVWYLNTFLSLGSLKTATVTGQIWRQFVKRFSGNTNTVHQWFICTSEKIIILLWLVWINFTNRIIQKLECVIKMVLDIFTKYKFQLFSSVVILIIKELFITFVKKQKNQLATQSQ